MKKIIIGMMALTSASTFAADFTLQVGKKNTITVEGCGKSAVGDVQIKSFISGEHRLTSRCLPIYCGYVNETPLTWLGTKWTIKLMARDTTKDSQGPIKGDPQFDRRYDKVIHSGIETKSERDELLKSYLQDGTCKGVFYDKNVPAV